jgi:LmbE family N-acetylglucosaminyl deacetylase
MNPLGKNILIIIAHPDDESFLATGLIYGNHQAGGDTTLLCATLGEKGKYHMPHPISATDLKRLRRQELIRVSKFLRVSKLKILNLPDGSLAQHKPELFREVQVITQKMSPDIIVSFGPDGITGHKDHIAAYQIATKLSQKLSIPLLKFALPPKVIPTASRWLAIRRKNNHYVNDIAYAKPNLKIKTSPKRKLAALKMHRSQFGNKGPLYNFPPKLRPEILSAEYFVY